MAATLQNAANPLRLFCKIFDEYFVQPREATHKSLREYHLRNDLKMVAAQRAKSGYPTLPRHF